jgi:hypothetical protein
MCACSTINLWMFWFFRLNLNDNDRLCKFDPEQGFYCQKDRNQHSTIHTAINLVFYYILFCHVWNSSILMSALFVAGSLPSEHMRKGRNRILAGL